jgi:DNA-binding response OmpR family regulator
MLEWQNEQRINGGNQMRVMILEYEAILCDLIRLKLESSGFIPVVCKDPIYVRDEIMNQQPDALVIDSCLPYQNGIDLLRELKYEGLLVHTHVIILSTLGFSCIVKQAVEAGADDFLVKPINVDVLASKLKSNHKLSENEMILSAELMNF